jgi:hypothetical protein
MTRAHYLKNPSLDDAAREREFRQSTRPAAAPSRKDIEQDAQIRALQRETRELRIYVAALIRLLGQNQTIAPAEMDALMALADRFQQHAPSPFRRHPSTLRDLIEPTKISSAA